MNFFIDANLPASTRKVLEAYGKVWHANDVGLGTASDTKIVAYALRHRAVLVTRDLEFGNPSLYPPGTHAGLIVLRTPSLLSLQATLSVLEAGLAALDPSQLGRSVVVIEPGRVRIRTSGA